MTADWIYVSTYIFKFYSIRRHKIIPVVSFVGNNVVGFAVRACKRTDSIRHVLTKYRKGCRRIIAAFVSAV